MILEHEFIWRLAIAALLGAVLGLERSLAGKHAGMRTYALVSMGSALFTIVGIAASYQFSAFSGVHPLILAGYIIVGIGFIGSGLGALGGSHPVELTTASGVWVVAGIGIAAGFGYSSIAVASTVFAIIIFTLLARIERRVQLRFGSKYNSNE